MHICTCATTTCHHPNATAPHLLNADVFTTCPPVATANNTLPEGSLAHQVLTCLPYTTATTTTAADRGYHQKPKKGKPIPKGPLRARIQRTCGVVVAVVGPDFIGITTLLRLLERAGHPPTFLATKPPASQRHTFDPPHLDDLITAWAALPRTGSAQIVEDSPWAYYSKHAAAMPPDQRHHFSTRLAQLTLPELTIILHAAGRTIGLRHPCHHTSPENYSPIACEQGRALDFPLGLSATWMPRPTLRW